MCTKAFLDSADIGYLLQVAVHILITRDGEQYSSLNASGVILVFFENCHRDIQQRNITHIIRLLACLANPIVSVIILCDMLGGELLNIYKCQSRKGGEDKYITHQCKARQRKLLLVYCHKFVHRQEFSHNLLFVELNARKRILIYPLVGKCKVGNLLQALHIADNSILLAVLLTLQIELKGSHQFAIHLGNRNILLPVFEFEKFCKIAGTTFVASYGD